MPKGQNTGGSITPTDSIPEQKSMGSATASDFVSDGGASMDDDLPF